MKRRPKQPLPEENSSAFATDAEALLQVKIWLVGISPMVWRRVLVPARFTLRELHGVIQVAMGWEGIHLYDFGPGTRSTDFRPSFRTYNEQ
jgi:hypothetical protein